MATATEAELDPREIELDPEIAVRSVDQATVDAYAESGAEGDVLAGFPPTLVYQLADGTLLNADGVHRTLAARKNGQRIRSIIRRGSRRDAMLAAALSNSGHGLRLTAKQNEARLRRAHQMTHWEPARLAKEAGVQPHEAAKAVAAERLFSATGIDMQGESAVAITSLPRVMWSPVAETYAERAWRRIDVREAARALKSGDLTLERLLAGEGPGYRASAVFDPLDSRTREQNNPLVPIHALRRAALVARELLTTNGIPEDATGPELREALGDLVTVAAAVRALQDAIELRLTG